MQPQGDMHVESPPLAVRMLLACTAQVRAKVRTQPGRKRGVGPVIETSPVDTYKDALDKIVSSAWAVAWVNGKGGVGKTSCSANTAGCAAAGGARVLVIDLDLNGSLAMDLGLTHAGKDDQGAALAEAIWKRQPLPVIKDVRENLDVVLGGQELEIVEALRFNPNVDVEETFASMVADVVQDYQLVIIDCPPGGGVLQDMALGVSAYVAIPTRTDPGSWKGLRNLGLRVNKARKHNPYLTYLGIVIFANATSAKTVLKNTRARLDKDLGGSVPIFDTRIRASETVAYDARRRGQLVQELAQDVQAAPKWYETLKGGGAVNAPQAGGDVADGLSSDYMNLTKEMVVRIRDYERAEGAPA